MRQTTYTLSCSLLICKAGVIVATECMMKIKRDNALRVLSIMLDPVFGIILVMMMQVMIMVMMDFA